MKTLAVEFSSDQRSVAIMDHGNVLGDALEIAARASRTFELIERALKEARLKREDIECIAIGIGPGSYTGIRSAIALAQGWQLTRPIQLLGISSVECLAAAAQSEGWLGKVNVVIDAQRNELYLARYEINSEGYCEVAPLKLATLDEVRRDCAGEIMVGPGVHQWFAEGRPLFPSATILGRLAANRTNFVPGEKLEPIYLREISFIKAPPPRVPPPL